MTDLIKEWALEVFDKRHPCKTYYRIQHATSEEQAVRNWISYNEGWAVKKAKYIGLWF